MKKRITALLTILTLLLATTAFAYTNTNDIYNVVDFKFFKAANGIGCGLCPVYTAPSKSAYRVGNASCNTNYELYLVGLENGWLLVRYETNNGGVRVGYIPLEYVSGAKNTIKSINRGVDYISQFSYIERTATEDLYITDNPKTSNVAFSSFGKIRRGATYWILGKYTYYGNWWYVETIIDGQYARGFISRDSFSSSSSSAFSSSSSSSASSSYSSAYPSNNIGTITVTGDASIVRQNADTNSPMVARVNAYEQYPYYEVKRGNTANLWYYIYVDGVWGWLSGGRCRVN